ncbi:hypothetical protein TNCV_1116441 [Trichonephila clavipes]|nr:hypothetical protein TNCV_1116441 [Trichonephila clavipes]
MRPLFPLGQVTNWGPCRKTGIRRVQIRQVALQAQPFGDVLVGPTVFGSRKEFRVVHRDTNHFRVFASSGMLAMDGSGYRLAIMVKHVGINC